MERFTSRIKKRQRLFVFTVVAVLSAGTMFFQFNRQKTSVFDEIYFGAFAQHYQQGTYFFDIHPPLGKLLISASTYPDKIPANTTFANGTDTIPNGTLFRLRLIPALAGFLLPIVGVAFAYQIGLRHRYAALAGLLLVFENARLAQSRLILLDSMLLLFGLSALLCAALYYRRRQYRYLAAAGLLAAMAGSVKWTALCYLLFVGVAALYVLLKKTRNSERLRAALLSVLCVIVLPAALYYGTYAVHFALLKKSGPGDAFMSARFQSTLENSYYYNPDAPMSTFSKIVELNKTMYSANKSTGSHPYSSEWYEWPIMGRTVYYYVQGSSRIYFIGNPVVWYACLLGLIGTLAWFVKERFRALPKTDIALVGALLASWLPFIFIGRVMFLYHYLTPLVISIFILMRLFQRVRIQDSTYYAFVVLVVAGFVWYAPLTYGLPVQTSGNDMRLLFDAWR